MRLRPSEKRRIRQLIASLQRQICLTKEQILRFSHLDQSSAIQTQLNSRLDELETQLKNALFALDNI